jgi:tripartite-type tricarboxylate transporter receptor subunit TctC
MKKTIIMSILSLMSAVTTVTPAVAETSQETIKLISTYPVGGPGDNVVRAVQTRIKKELGKNVIIDYKLGAGLACNELTNSKETMIMISHPAFITNSILNPSSACDYTKVVPLALLGNWPMMLTVSKQFNQTNIKKWPTGATYASSGIGTGGHLLGEMLNVAIKGEMVHVPYKGVPQYLPDLISGRVDAAFTPSSAIVPYILNDQLLAVAVTGKQRLKELPNVPTLDELGYKSVTSPTWMHVFTNNIDSSDALKIQAILKKAAGETEFVNELQTIGLDVVEQKNTIPPKDYVTSEHTKFDKIINKFNKSN